MTGLISAVKRDGEIQMALTNSIVLYTDQGTIKEQNDSAIKRMYFKDYPEVFVWIQPYSFQRYMLNYDEPISDPDRASAKLSPFQVLLSGARTDIVEINDRYGKHLVCQIDPDNSHLFGEVITCSQYITAPPYLDFSVEGVITDLPVRVRKLTDLARPWSIHLSATADANKARTVIFETEADAMAYRLMQ